MDSWYLVHWKQEREVNKEIGVIICLGLYSKVRVLSKPSYCFWRTAHCPVWFWLFWSLTSFCLPWAFQPLGVKCGLLAPQISDGAGLHLPCQSCFCPLWSLMGESGDMMMCSCAPLVSPCLNLPKEISINFPKLSKGNPKKDLCGKTIGKFSIHQKTCFVRQTQCSKSSYIALLSSKLLLLCYGNLVCWFGKGWS